MDRFLETIYRPIERSDLLVIEQRRSELERSTERVGDAFEALGDPGWSDVKTAVRSDSSPAAKVGLLVRLVELVKPRRTVELGSAFGISGSYFVAGIEAAGGGEFCTIEAAATRSAIARESIALVSAPRVRVELLVGLFDDHLDALDNAELVYVDGNHYADPTRRYTEAALTRASADLVVVLDDVVGYSKEMDAVWDEMRRDVRFDVRGEVADVGILARGRPAATLLAASKTV